MCILLLSLLFWRNTTVSWWTPIPMKFKTLGKNETAQHPCNPAQKFLHSIQKSEI